MTPEDQDAALVRMVKERTDARKQHALLQKRIE
jgi:hypothetical protein